MTNFLSFALAVAISPAPLIAAILLFTGDNGPTKWFAYLTGWLVALITLIIPMLLLVGSRDFTPGSMAAQVAAWLIVLAGITLLFVIYAQWHQISAPDNDIIAIQWLRTIPNITWLSALGAGLFFGLFSAKNVLLTAAIAFVIEETTLEPGARVMAVLLYIATATLGIVAPAFVACSQGSRARSILNRWEYSLSIYNSVITCGILSLIAIQLLSLGIGRLLLM
jgi:Sap, sulfolipid-1-addressing protein